MITYNHLKKEVKYTKIEEIIQLINGGRYDELKYRDDSILDNKEPLADSKNQLLI